APAAPPGAAGRAWGPPPVETPMPVPGQTVGARRGEAPPARGPTCEPLLVCTGVIPRGGAPPPVRAGERAACGRHTTGCWGRSARGGLSGGGPVVSRRGQGCGLGGS